MRGNRPHHQISGLRKRLIDSNARSIFVNAHPKKSMVKLDLHSIAKLCQLDLNSSFLNDFLFNSSFKIELSKPAPLYEKIYQKWVHIFRKNEASKNDLNLDPLGFGYPLVLIKTKKKQLQLTPVFVWDATIKQSSTKHNHFSLKIRRTEMVTVNPSLLRYIHSMSDIGDPIEMEEAIKNNPEQLIQTINVLLGKWGKKEVFKDFFKSPIQPLWEDLVTSYQNENHLLINNGVLGLYANSKEPIITDFLHLEGETIPCHFKPKKDSNTTHFSGLELDHSQQGVIRSLSKGKNSIIHGPPGTGKSKTITAVLHYALSKGQNCLLICEKKTAMDVIYENLNQLGLSDYAVKVTDVMKDRRSIVNKARNIITLEKKGRNDLFELSKIEGKTESPQQIENKIKYIKSTVGLISKTKEKLLQTIKESNHSYSDMVLSVRTNELKLLSKRLQFNPSLFTFSTEEWESILLDLAFVKEYLKTHKNPFRTFYHFVNKDFISPNKKSTLERLFYKIHDSYLERIHKLISEWKLQGKKLSAFEIKYFNYVKSDNTKLKSLYEQFVKIKKHITACKLFDSTYLKQLDRLEPVLQLEKIAKVLEMIRIGLDEFDKLLPFHQYFIVLPKLRKKCLMSACELEDFEKVFHRWYLGNILEKNHRNTLDFNGFGEGYFDLVEDLKKVNQYFTELAHTHVKKSRNEAIMNFDQKNSLSIEQFFSKRNTSKRVKLPLHKITKDPSKIFYNLFPIIITNPTSCSLLFPMEVGFFDFVVFDESSQLRIEDTFPALLRGKIRVVSGDSQQLPPSNYFREVTEDKNEMEQGFKMSSLLGYCKTKSFHNHYLDIHYRSNHPALIQFSNHAFYKKRLIPLPPQKKYTPIDWIPVNGFFINRTNYQEAITIINYLSSDAPINQSIGVATFSQFQQNLILDMILNKSIKNPEFKNKMEALSGYGFFVKNIENIQGEERDIMLISTTYGPNIHGKFNQFFGPLNTKGKGHKLLNVLITRAIKKIKVFSSVPELYYKDYKHHLDEKGAIGKGVFYAFLSYASAVSNQDDQQQHDILNALSPSQERLSQKTIYKKEDLSSFTEHLVNKLTQKYARVINCYNGYALGGITYEVLIAFDNKKKLLIDINGKMIHKEYEDYLFDIYRCKIAHQSGYRYYRLWLSNYYNQPEKEIKNMLRVVGLLKKGVD